ncbi:MAG TPA: hypothetical protein VFQ45_15005 [Longimicrobium sp.]|nr:hypothetical protein [Longimicrobium sp.]
MAGKADLVNSIADSVEGITVAAAEAAVPAGDQDPAYAALAAAEAAGAAA